MVTGSNPIESRIEDEPYWSDLHGLLKWSSENVQAMVLSCLSAHAAVAVFDGVERTALPGKCTGVFAQESDPTHPLVAGLYGSVVLPHSRLNAVPKEAVVRAGYSVALRSEEVGWSVVTKTVGQSEVVLVRPMPSTTPRASSASTARDVRRYAGHEHDQLPCLPLDCVTGPDWDGLRRLHERIVGGERDSALVAATSPSTRSVPAPPGRGKVRGPASLYANLFGTIFEEERLRPCTTRPSQFTVATHPTGRGPWPCPSTRRWPNDFIDAAHAGAVLDLETPGFHYNRLNNPTLDVLEQRICALEGGTAALVVASGMAAVSYAILTVASAGSNFVVAPQLYGANFPCFAHVLPTLGIEARFAVDDRAESIAPLIDENTRAVFCETIGNPAGNIVDLEAVAAVAHAAGVPLIVDNLVATPLMLKPFEHGANVVVDSLTKFVGGHGTTLGGAMVDGGRLPVGRLSRPLPHVQPARACLPRCRLRPRLPRAAIRRPGPLHATAQQRRHPLALQHGWLLSCRASRRWPCGSSATRPTPGPWPTTWPPDSPGGLGELRRLPRPSLPPPGRALSARASAVHHHLRGHRGGLRRGPGLLRCAPAHQAAAQSGRRQDPGHPSGLHHPPSSCPTRSW